MTQQNRQKFLLFSLCAILLTLMSGQAEALSDRGRELLEQLKVRNGLTSSTDSTVASDKQEPAISPEPAAPAVEVARPAPPQAEPAGEPRKATMTDLFSDKQEKEEQAQNKNSRNSSSLTSKKSEKAPGKTISKPVEETDKRDSQPAEVSSLPKKSETPLSNASLGNPVYTQGGEMSNLLKRLRDKVGKNPSDKDQTSGSQVMEIGKRKDSPEPEKAVTENRVPPPETPRKPTPKAAPITSEADSPPPPRADGHRTFADLSDDELIQYAKEHVWSKEKSRKHNPPWTPPSKPSKAKKAVKAAQSEDKKVTPSNKVVKSDASADAKKNKKKKKKKETAS